MADTLTGSISQFINKCKDRIQDWAKDVCLPLAGGTVTGDVAINGETTLNDAVTITNNKTLTISGSHNAKNKRGIVITGDNQSYCFMVQDTGIPADRVVSSARTLEGIVWYGSDISDSDKQLGCIYNELSTTKTSSVKIRATNSSSNHVYLTLVNNDDNTKWATAPTPTKLENDSVVVDKTNNSDRIATTKWVNQFLPEFLKTTAAYATSPTSNKEIYVSGNSAYNVIKFKNGFQILWGTCWNVNIGTVVTFSHAFTKTPTVVATRHYSNPTFVLNDNTATGVHVYNTTTTGFTIGVNKTTTEIDTSNAKIYALWIAIGI